MPRQVLQSNSAILLQSFSPAFQTGNPSGVLVAGVSSSSFSFSAQRERGSQVGSQEYIVNDVIRHPNVNFSVNYYLTSKFLNEKFLGLQTNSADPRYSFSGFGDDQSYNFTYLVDPTENRDALEEYKEDESGDWSGWTVLFIGSAFLSSYEVGFTVGSIPEVSLNFDCSNISYQLSTGSGMRSPAINLESGNNDNVGYIDFKKLADRNQSGAYDRSSPNVSVPGNVSLSLQNKQMGGQALSGNHSIQSLNLSLTIPREEAYRFGSDYVADRSIQYPIQGTLNLESLVSGFQEGDITGMLDSETRYDLGIGFTDHKETHYGEFVIEDAVIDSFQYSMIASDLMQMNASFSFGVGQNHGLKTFSRPNIVTEKLYTFIDVEDLRCYTGATNLLYDLNPSTGSAPNVVLLDDDSDGSNSYSSDYRGYVNLQDQHYWHGSISFDTTRVNRSITIVLRPQHFFNMELWSILNSNDNPQFNANITASDLNIWHHGLASSSTSFSYTFELGKWYVISASDDATNGRIKGWVNGVPVGDTAVGGSNYQFSADRLRIFARKLGSFNEEVVDADLMAFMYHTDLVYTDEQALQNYNSFKDRILAI